MTVTASSLKAQHPEFATGSPSDTVITGFIQRAQRRLDETAYGDTYDDAVELLACHLISLSPGGRDLRLNPRSTESVYLSAFKELQRNAGAAFRTLGED
jgi:hypothetical protein